MNNNNKIDNHVIFLRSVSKKYLMRFQSETSVFKFLRRNMHVFTWTGPESNEEPPRGAFLFKNPRLDS